MEHAEPSSTILDSEVGQGLAFYTLWDQLGELAGTPRNVSPARQWLNFYPWGRGRVKRWETGKVKHEVVSEIQGFSSEVDLGVGMQRAVDTACVCLTGKAAGQGVLHGSAAQWHVLGGDWELRALAGAGPAIGAQQDAGVSLALGGTAVVGLHRAPELQGHGERQDLSFDDSTQVCFRGGCPQALGAAHLDQQVNGFVFSLEEALWQLPPIPSLPEGCAFEGPLAFNVELLTSQAHVAGLLLGLLDLLQTF